MWVFTKYGFYSVACAKDRHNNADPEKVMVRARVRLHLENLIERFDELTYIPILEDAGADYRYRLILPHGIWDNIAYKLSMEIDYLNFKNSVEPFAGKSAYEKKLLEVWVTMMGMQIDEERENAADKDIREGNISELFDSPEAMLQQLKASQEDIEAGRVHDHEDIAKEIG